MPIDLIKKYLNGTFTTHSPPTHYHPLCLPRRYPTQDFKLKGEKPLANLIGWLKPRQTIAHCLYIDQ